ncbi:MAG: protein-export chaperone SecB [Oscillospiraceae bacterium]|nr:protein-export chaperone SecB [Oscillospiraceae bacterium]
MGAINFQMMTNEISLKNNNLPDGNFKFAPTFTRQVRKDEKFGCTRLIVEAKNTKENPFPIDIKVDVMARIELAEVPEEARDEFLDNNAVSVLLPYVRTMITNITSSALMVPIVLPMLDPHELFPKDKENKE